MRPSAEQQRRINRAVIENIQQWIGELEEIEFHAIPGNKGRILHLQRNMMQAKRALERLIAALDDSGV